MESSAVIPVCSVCVVSNKAPIVSSVIGQLANEVSNDGKVRFFVAQSIEGIIAEADRFGKPNLIVIDGDDKDHKNVIPLMEAAESGFPGVRVCAIPFNYECGPHDEEVAFLSQRLQFVPLANRMEAGAK